MTSDTGEEWTLDLSKLTSDFGAVEMHDSGLRQIWLVAGK